jgi:predicted dehydrogenase
MKGVQVRWLVDVSPDRISETQKALGTPAKGTTSFLDPLNDPELDIVIVAVPDNLHRAVAEPAFLAGKHVFLEKPLATTAADARAILKAWQQSGRVLQVGYVLRQTPFYTAIRRLVRSGALGAVRMVYLSEQLDVRHGASFMRRWHASSEFSGGLIVHKACHDLDLICWLLNAKPRVVGSFGGSDTFSRPAPAQFCSQCSERRECPYVDTALHERRTLREAVDPTAYGLDRCVFHADKDIVDNQVVSFELDTGARGSFHLSVQGPLRSERHITLIGDQATLDGTFEDGRFTVFFTNSERPPIHWSAPERSSGHGGGDPATMFEFLNACAGRSPPPIRSYDETIQGLVFALAAERSRRERSLVSLVDSDFALPQNT